jgi:outer membrane protein assembly factor BamB
MGAQITVLANALNSFSGMVSVSESGLPTGVTATPATVNLAPGTPQTITLAAGPSVTSAAPTITFSGSSGGITHTASVALTIQGAVLTNAPDITTYHDDVARDGVNSQETILTLNNVNSTQFGKIGFDTVDGLVDAQPLYIANVVAGGRLRNVIYVASEHDSVYAFDADTGEQIWKTSVLGSGETTSDDRGCGQVTPEIGITSTPVIDRKQGTNGTLFAIAMSKDAAGNYHQRLHALDITTGAEVAGSPTEVAASYPGSGAHSSNGSVVFDPRQYKERAALLLLNGNVYAGWSSHCDYAPYTGWVMAYSEATLQQTQVLNVTPNGSDGSIWMSGGGLAAGDGGYIYFLDANGTFDTTLDGNGFPATGDFGNAILKLSTAGKLAVADYFEPYNTVAESDNDVDMGSGGAVLLPDQTDAQGIVRHLLAGGGKDGNLYVADRDHLGGFNAGGSNGNLYQFIQGAISGAMFSTPAFFNGVLYAGAVGDALKAFPATQAKLATAASSRSATAFAYPGTTPSVSANGTQSGIVWALESGTSAAAVLHAYDATNLAHELYNSQQAPNGRDSFGNGNKYIAPLIVNGKVYVGTPTGVAVFGLLSR